MRACVCFVSVSVRVCVCACRPVIQQFVWVGSLFWFLLFFSPFQCFPPLLCSKDKFGRFAKFITFHLWNPTPLHPSSTSSSPPFPSPLPRPPLPPPTPGYLYWSVGPLLCASLLFMFESAMLRVRLGSIHCRFYQPSKEIQCVIDLLMTKHSNTFLLFFCALFGKRDLSYRTLQRRNPKLDLTRFVCEHQKQTAGGWINVQICQIDECFDSQYLTKLARIVAWVAAVGIKATRHDWSDSWV